MIKNILLLSLLLLSGCTNREDAERALTSEGYSNIHITGYAWFACSEDDRFHTAFTAVNRDGKQVSGVVCSGLFFKNATIRW